MKAGRRNTRAALRIALLSIGGIIWCASLTSCGVTSRASIQITPDAPRNAPAQFLATSFGPLSNWLDARFEVNFTDMPISDLLSRPPFNEMNFTFEEPSSDSDRLTLEASNISRREILLHVTRHSNYRAEYIHVSEGDGKPVGIRMVPDGPAAVARPTTS